jgi:hypothetical protein
MAHEKFNEARDAVAAMHAPMSHASDALPPDSQAMLDALRRQMQIGENHISIQAWGFEIVLCRDGTYFVADTAD